MVVGIFGLGMFCVGLLVDVGMYLLDLFFVVVGDELMFVVLFVFVGVDVLMVGLVDEGDVVDDLVGLDCLL